jgi:tetratricopeptide (TPR) repeat protein
VDLRRNNDAKPELEAAARLDPSFAGPQYLLGLIAKQSGNTEEAIALFKKDVELDPNNADAHYMLGQELAHSGKADAAIAEWRKALQIQPDYSEALYNLSRLLAKSDPEEANRLKAQFENLQAQQHIMDRAQTLGNFALASADARDWPEAIAHLKEGLQVCGDCSAKALLHKDLGLIYCRSGDLKNGRAELLEARKLSPADPDISKALQILDTHTN